MNQRKGIILAGGLGTRFAPVSVGISKHLIPIFDKPMIYYSLSTLMLADVREILLISTERDIQIFKNLLGDGSSWGIQIDYVTQEAPKGIAQAFLLAENFVDNSPSVLILGDNFFYGDGLKQKLLKVSKNINGATIFGYRVKDPERYGIAEYDENGKVINIIEKPKKFISDIAVTGIYFYDNKACEYAKQLKPSKRGEFEITDLNKIYLEKEELYIEKMGRGYAWLDAGTPDSLLEASQFVQTIEHRQGLKICCPEEIAFKKSWVSKETILKSLENYKNAEYAQYINNLLRGN